MEHADIRHGDDSSEEILEVSPESPRKLPDDLPKSLDDRRSFPSYGGETEMYDAWQGKCPFLVVPSWLCPLTAIAATQLILQQARLNSSLRPYLRSHSPSTYTSIVLRMTMKKRLQDWRTAIPDLWEC